MRFARFLLLFVVSSSLTFPTAAQQTSTSPSQPVQKAPVGLQGIARMIAATGWKNGALPVDILATGTLMRDSGNQAQPSNFVLKQRGASQHRFDLQDNGATATTIVNGLAGAVILPNGTTQRLLAHAAFSIQSPAFPFLTDLLNASDPAVEVDTLGTGTIDGTLCQGVLVARRAQSGDPLGASRDLAAPLKIWFSQQTALPVRIDFVRLALDNHYVAMHFSRSFSDYRVVKGIAVAFQQEERFEGQLMYHIQFTDVQFGAALSDSDFALPKH
jgi:hypothetical protein